MSLKQICLIGNSHIGQFNSNDYKDINVDKLYSLGASIKGLTNSSSKLKLGEKIINYQNNNPNTILYFFLGQVDVEFGYYYKCVIDNVKYDINIYIQNLINEYEKFLINNITNTICILSINPTVITDIFHNFIVSFGCTNGGDAGYSITSQNNLYQYHTYKDTIYNDTYEIRYNYNKLFNDQLEIMCKRNNYKYINFWNIITENNIVKKEYMPIKVDHHLINNSNNLFNHILDKSSELFK